MIEVPGCRILVRPLKLEEQDETMRKAKAVGIQFLDQDERKMKTTVDRGVVLKIGPKVSEDYTQGVEIGSTIGFAKFGGKFVTDINSTEELLVINDEDVICIFKDEK